MGLRVSKWTNFHEKIHQSNLFYNNLPGEIKELNNIKIFKKKTYEYIVNIDIKNLE